MKLIPLLLLAGALVAGCASPQGRSITVKCPDSLRGLGQKWGEAFMAKHPEVKVRTVGGAAAGGFTALQNRTADIAMAGRKMNAAECSAYVKCCSKRPHEYRVALESVSVYVNADNPINELDLGQLRKIFTLAVKNWKGVGGRDAAITLYCREKRSSTSEFFKESVLNGAALASSAQAVPGTAALVDALARDKNGIGIGGPSENPSAKALKIKKSSESKAIEPGAATVAGGKYPIRHYLYCYVSTEKDKGDVAAYLDWIRGEEGQKVAKEAGCDPLPENLREK